ncbi:FG-GAP repeat protein [Aeoliella sp. SH292]|uniref:FG-GAP repeat protein n=1 Tax=Aeoliella sp. SH292 TaxID=3454464 RepID=UPI003F9B1C79
MDRFGQSVALSGGYALISAGGYDGDGFLNSGEAYLFDTTSGMLVHTFENPTPENNAGFGGVVAMHGDYALIADFEGRGKAHLFDITTRELVRTFVNPGRSTSYFGQAMAMNDHFALIGAPIGGGSAYLFDLASGELLHTFANPSPEQYDRYAIGVALGPHHAFVGQVPHAVTSPVSGEAFVYYVVPEPPAATPLMLAMVLSCCLFRRIGPRFSTES